jgi:5,10-methylenetetrahydromethanopterin reductase
MEVSCAFPTALDAPDNIALAERLGYARAWVYDTPQQSPDVWMILALAAERTERIGLGPGVLVPSLRHPMVNAARDRHPRRPRPRPCRDLLRHRLHRTPRHGVPRNPLVLHGVLHPCVSRAAPGEVVEWEGAQMQMLHPEGHAPARPVEVPILIAALGPKGNKVASHLGDGLYVTLQLPEFMRGYSWVPYLAWDAVLDEGEALDSEHARAAGGPGWALAYHGAYEVGGPEPYANFPGGAGWMDVVAKTPLERRHLAVHAGHCVALNEADQAAWNAGGHAILQDVTISGTRDQVRRRLDDLASRGVTEIVFQPVDPTPEPNSKGSSTQRPPDCARRVVLAREPAPGAMPNALGLGSTGGAGHDHDSLVWWLGRLGQWRCWSPLQRSSVPVIGTTAARQLSRRRICGAVARMREPL